MKLPVSLTWKSRILLTQMLWMVIIWVVANNIFFFIRFVGQPNAASPINPNIQIGISAFFLNETTIPGDLDEKTIGKRF